MYYVYRREYLVCCIVWSHHYFSVFKIQQYGTLNLDKFSLMLLKRRQGKLELWWFCSLYDFRILMANFGMFAGRKYYLFIIYEWMEPRRRSLKEDRLRIWEIWKDGGTIQGLQFGASCYSAAFFSMRFSCSPLSHDRDFVRFPTGS